MKTIITTNIILWSLLLMQPGKADAQSIVGRWKRVSSTITMVDGGQKSFDKMLRQSVPCSADYVYIFAPDGTMKTDISACDDIIRKKMEAVIEATNRKSRWSQSGNKVTASTTDSSLPSSVHEISFSDNTMTWQFNFVDNPKVPNPTKAKAMTIVYKRI